MIKKVSVLKHDFVEFIPDKIVDGTLYISIKFSTTVHNCCCGCGNEVVAPISPTDWKIIFDGKSVSLDPSIGNWSFDCKSHYWVIEGKIKWARKWSDKEIKMGRRYDYHSKEVYFKDEEKNDQKSDLKSKDKFLKRLGKFIKDK